MLFTTMEETVTLTLTDLPAAVQEEVARTLPRVRARLSHVSETHLLRKLVQKGPHA